MESLRKSSRIRERLRTLAQGIRMPFLRSASDFEKEYIVKIFSDTPRERISASVKFRVFELMKKLRAEKRGKFGFLLVLGWTRKWNEHYMSIPDILQNLFEKKSYSVMADNTEETVQKLARMIEFDGAVLVSPRGKICASGAFLENMKPKHVLEHMGVNEYVDLSQGFGFSHKVHTRHLSGIACSFLLKGTLVFVISEEDGSFRIFENGKIIYSPYRKEISWNMP